MNYKKLEADVKKETLIPIILDGEVFGGIVLVRPMIEHFVGCVKRDKRTFSNINIYYELMNSENCKKQGVPNDLKNFNCLDGDDLYNLQKNMRENSGYIYMPETDVVIEGIRCKRIIIKVPGVTNVGDFFGIISGYAQASTEIVCYKVSYGTYFK